MQLSDPLFTHPRPVDVNAARRLIADDVHLLAPLDVMYAGAYEDRMLSVRLDRRDTDKILDAVLSSPEGRRALRTLLESRCA